MSERILNNFALVCAATKEVTIRNDVSHAVFEVIAVQNCPFGKCVEKGLTH